MAEKARDFMDVTGADKAQAEFYLEAAKGNLETAIANFLDAGAGQAGRAAPLLGGPVRAAAPQTTGDATGRGGKIRTLGDVGGAPSGSDDANTYFSGSERSGVLMKGPGKGKGRRGDADDSLVASILEQAAQGASALDDDDDDSADGHAPSAPSYFGGAGRRLGDTGPAASSVSSGGNPAPLPTVDRSLIFWRDGFSVDDGELHRYDDPASQALLQLIHSGQAPPSLLNIRPGQPVNVKVSKQLDEDYHAPPPKPVEAFSGAGQRLGGYVPGTPSAPVAAAPPSAAPRQLTLDAAQPVTSLQIRLLDGTRLVAKFNHTHRVQDVRDFIDASGSGGAAPYVLASGFPAVPLTDPQQTLADAKLLNAVVLQKRA